MKMTFYLSLFILLLACGGSDNGIEPPQPEEKVISWTITPESLTFPASGETKSIRVSANGDWKVVSSQAWCTLDRADGHNGETSLKVSAQKNVTEAPRSAELTFTSASGKQTKKITVSQEKGTVENYVPAGYSLVWKEEFDAPRISGGKPALPDSKWFYENFKKGTVNNELQTYVPGFSGQDTVAAIYDGTLKIIAKKQAGEIISARMNTQQAWQYGYFEARLRMPTGKGTWPAFWMMPVDMSLGWPTCGEIDIMEYVGYQPNVVHSTVHTKAYNHTIGTQKGTQKTIENAETEFHIYAVEWTTDYIKGFVDGAEYFRFDNDKKGDVNTWPFDKPFYLKLNLAWGGDWGGAQGVDESKLPATYEIDYVRVYQK